MIMIFFFYLYNYVIFLLVLKERSNYFRIPRLFSLWLRKLVIEHYNQTANSLIVEKELILVILYPKEWELTFISMSIVCESNEK